MSGRRPYTYSTMRPSGKANNKAYLNSYELSSEDWFEVGDAYSLHLTEKGARAFNPGMGWCRTNVAEEVFVSKSVLEAAKSGRRPKHVFSSWEN